MRKDIAEEWTARLDSGNYLQGTGFLRQIDAGSADRYCCLGVLCEIAVEAGVIDPGEKGIKSGKYSYGSDDAEGILPLEVMRWAEISDSDGTFLTLHSDHQDIPRLIEMNDELKATFSQIATVIRENYTRL